MEYWQRLRQAVGQDTMIIPGAAGAIAHEGKIPPISIQTSEIAAYPFLHSTKFQMTRSIVVNKKFPIGRNFRGKLYLDNSSL
ncbi:MAG TPA: hypothetical protein VK206_21260, partial [Anaerolineales bacterium]|nr:hypothetical protein [Anaerolineales bacterium]